MYDNNPIENKAAIAKQLAGRTQHALFTPEIRNIKRSMQAVHV